MSASGNDFHSSIVFAHMSCWEKHIKPIQSFLSIFLVIGIVLPTIVACNGTMPIRMDFTKRPIDPNSRPDWVVNPGDGVSAAAGTHVKGKVAQEELAIQRAREEFAKRFGVTIESEQVNFQVVANGRANTAGQKVTHEETMQRDVKAQVKAKWRDPNSDMLWVWLMPAGS